MKTIGIKSQQTIKIVEKPQIKQGDNIKLENTIYGDFEITVKEIKPEQDNKTVIIAENQIVEETTTNNNTNTIENLMSNMLAEVKNDKNITFEITLTKRQKTIWDKKGGVAWLKKKLV